MSDIMITIAAMEAEISNQLNEKHFVGLVFLMTVVICPFPKLLEKICNAAGFHWYIRAVLCNVKQEDYKSSN